MIDKIQEIYQYLIDTAHNEFHVLWTGSRAMGVEHENSDWDFYICPNQKLGLYISYREKDIKHFLKIINKFNGIILQQYSEEELIPIKRNEPSRYKRYVGQINILDNEIIHKVNIIFESDNNYDKWAQATEYCKKYKHISKDKTRRIKIFNETFGIENGVSVYRGQSST